ncbi:hypothetical protein M3398_20630 [Streptomyces albidoflavus]|uniref:hypothetical protein n=1 Tax=Streptomyces TaxID=1883 RepID=UPI0001AEE6A5|nr:MULTISPECIES: hypothetical protein [Streptomyces]AGI86813.1 Hypothetical protein XNR_0411 [Streptomyces albidoflavus]EFE85071.1 predicted protein [Streptomyces albidoflavus]MCL6279692.1 hypothetical protein [Streptomyces albidoflavus]MCX4463048.1 hypothetical protein [Streptomyces albidoflavus]QHC19086.1 hypothetical protein GR131_28665 [Streptomyces sp. GF20]
MAAESGKWAAKHTQNPPEKETIVENDPRPQSGSTPRGAADLTGTPAGTPDGARPAEAGTPGRPPADVPHQAQGDRATGTGTGTGTGSDDAVGGDRTTVKPQPLAGKNTADKAAGATGGKEAAPRAPQTDGAPQVPMFGAGEGERWTGRLQGAVNGFVDRPREAVAEADEVFAELAGRVTEALAEQRRVLRSGWEEPAGEPDTERLRVALQSYREASERLLKL